MRSIVLTGGPGGGKTTALNRIFEKLSDFGWAVVIAPEVATILFHESKVAIGNEATREAFELAILKLQLANEDALQDILNADPRSRKVLLCDRGAMDVRSYLEETEWQSIITKLGRDPLWLREHYDGVIHLETSAVKPGLYEEIRGTNAVRSEDAKQALEQDGKTRQAWLGHPHFRLIPTEEDFEAKLKKLWEEVCAILGIPVPIEDERKFRVALPIPDPFPLPSESVEIEQTYLLGEPGKEWRVRKRSQWGSVLHFFTGKDADPNAKRGEHEERISEERYRELLHTRRDPSRITIRKTRRCFLFQNQYFELDEFHHPTVDFALLEIELTREREDILLPDFLVVEGEVTEDPSYYNHAIALWR